MSLGENVGRTCSRTRISQLKTGLTDFLCSPASPRPFAHLRICLALSLLIKAACEFTSVLELYGERGLAPWAITELMLEEWTPRIRWLVVILRPLHVSSEACVWAVFGSHLLMLCGLLLGWRSRAMAVGAWITQLMLMNSGRLSVYGVDGFANMALFYLAIGPAGSALSLDRRAGRTSDTRTPTARILLRLLQAHLCIVYFSSGFLKTTGTQWWNGEAIWRALMAPQFRSGDWSWLSQVPWLLTFAGWGTLFLEIGYAGMVWWRPTRLVWVFGMIALHLSIAVLMGLWLFSLVMISLNIAAFVGEDVHSALRRVFRRSQPPN